MTDALISTGGPEGLRALTNVKAIVSDRWPWLIQTNIPRPLDYPIRSLSHGWCVFTLAVYLIGFFFANVDFSSTWQGLRERAHRAVLRRWLARSYRRSEPGDE